jgi:crotonobetainyl-CoA:carnitine CoA-transferase CaiB-like acyl-CoA transferase
VSLQEVVASTLVVHQPYYSWGGAVQLRRQSDGGGGSIQPCKDGYFVWQAAGFSKWGDIAEFFGREELKEERFTTADGRTIHEKDLDRLILEAAKDRNMEELFRTASEKYHMLFGIVQESEDLAKCEHLKARGFYEEVDHPVIGKIKVPFRLWNMSEGGARYRRPAPLLGQHNTEIYRDELGLDAGAMGALGARGVI